MKTVDQCIKVFETYLTVLVYIRNGKNHTKIVPCLFRNHWYKSTWNITLNIPLIPAINVNTMNPVSCNMTDLKR